MQSCISSWFSKKSKPIVELPLWKEKVLKKVEERIANCLQDPHVKKTLQDPHNSFEVT